MASYNPQLHVQVHEILPDGADQPFEVDFFSGQDQNHHSGSKPLSITCSIGENVGATQNTANITIHNSLYIEEFRKDPQAQLAKFKGKKLRLRVWAWYDDGGSTDKSAQPVNQPIFVGDMLNGFSINTSGVNDASIEIQAQGHSWLASSGKFRFNFLPPMNYLDVANEVMKHITEVKLQGSETNGDFPYFVVDDFDEKLFVKELLSPWTVNRNPLEVLNDICRTLDFVCGIHNNVPYIVARDRPFQPDKLPVGAQNQFDPKAICNYETGMLSTISYGTDGFSFDHHYDRNLFIGRVVEVSDEPQTGERGTFVAGRIRAMQATITNYSGHTLSIECDYLTEYDPGSPTESFVVLPERRADNSGLRSV